MLWWMRLRPLLRLQCLWLWTWWQLPVCRPLRLLVLRIRRMWMRQVRLRLLCCGGCGCGYGPCCVYCVYCVYCDCGWQWLRRPRLL